MSGMRRRLSRLRHGALRDERGITLVELLVAMMILSIISLVFTTTLTSVQRTVVREDIRMQLNDKARLAVQSIDRQVRSGNLLYPPSSEADPYGGATGYMFRVYTQANTPTEGQFRCALWLIDNQQQLKYRWWPALQPEDATEWVVVTNGVVNRTLGIPAFSVDSTNRTASVTFYLNPSYSTDPNATQQVKASLTGRNTSFGYPADICEDLPTGLT
jgi:prepilin-type N-terminal cleavage/methylation domain-containing protein